MRAPCCCCCSGAGPPACLLLPSCQQSTSAACPWTCQKCEGGCDECDGWQDFNCMWTARCAILYRSIGLLSSRRACHAWPPCRHTLPPPPLPLPPRAAPPHTPVEDVEVRLPARHTQIVQHHKQRLTQRVRQPTCCLHLCCAKGCGRGRVAAVCGKESVVFFGVWGSLGRVCLTQAQRARTSVNTTHTTHTSLIHTKTHTQTPYLPAQVRAWGA